MTDTESGRMLRIASDLVAGDNGEAPSDPAQIASLGYTLLAAHLWCLEQGEA